MKGNAFFSWAFMFSACALLAIGRVYDDRLVIAGINLVVIVSVVYLISVLILFSSIKKTVFSKSKILLYSFYLLVLITGPMLWLIFDITEFGFEKFINFWLIIVPVSIIIIEKYNRVDVLKTFYILLGVSCFLALLSSVGLSISARDDGRMAALGGGPIVFARWMGFGILSLLFLPIRIKAFYKYLVIVLFFILALASGSRGPILALFLTGFIFVILNFNKVIVKIGFVFLLLFSLLLFPGVGNKISKVVGFERVFMNVSKKGGSKQSTSTRTNLAIGSFILLQNYPLGVGAGNWQALSNEIRPTHMMPLKYPHNLLLEVACEYGIQTLLLLLLLLLFVLNLSYKKMIKFQNDKTSLYPLLFYLLLFFFLNSLVSGMLNDSRLLFIIISFIIIPTPLIYSENE